MENEWSLDLNKLEFIGSKSIIYVFFYNCAVDQNFGCSMLDMFWVWIRKEKCYFSKFLTREKQ